LEDPAGFLPRAYMLQLAEASENYAVEIGYQFGSSRSLKWKHDIRARGFALLDKYGYDANRFGQDPHIFLFEYPFVEKLAWAIHPITDPIIEGAI
jgi:hypothetical protein